MSDLFPRLLPANTNARNTAPQGADADTWFQILPGLWVPRPMHLTRHLQRVQNADAAPDDTDEVLARFDLGSMSLGAADPSILVESLPDGIAFLTSLANGFERNLRSPLLLPEGPLRQPARLPNLPALSWPNGKVKGRARIQARHRLRNLSLRAFVAAASPFSQAPAPDETQTERFLTLLGAQPLPTDLRVNMEQGGGRLIVDLEHKGQVDQLLGEFAVERQGSQLSVAVLGDPSPSVRAERYMRKHLLVAARCIEAAFGPDLPAVLIAITTGPEDDSRTRTLLIASGGWHLTLIEAGRYLSGKAAKLPAALIFG